MQMGSLTLSRRVGEKIVIGNGPDAITIEVMPRKGAATLLKVVAPRVIPVRREELPERTA